MQISSEQAPAMTPSTQRPIPLEVRPDLIFKRIDYLGVGYWVIKDPAGLKYFRLQQEQYEVLQLLDGERSLEQIRDKMLQIMPTVRLQLSDIQHLITDLHEKAVVYSNREGQGASLIKKHREERKKKFFNTFKSLLYLRLPGWDPEAVLVVIYPFCKLFFKPIGIIFFCTVVFSSWMLLAIQFDEFRRQLPAFQSFFGWPNLLYMWAVLGVAKVIHEFGHGLSCKHFGGECHEMGVMLLVFSPCLYCDVSDSWMLRNKWKRIMIGAAGMYIEILISAFAIFIWYFSEQGMLHNLALNTFFVTTITTVIFNANPLMRFDGYYMMSDFLEIPNLRPKADRLLRESFAWYCLGIESKPDPFMPETGRVWFVLFAICAGIYRWFIVIAITVFLYTVLKPYGLQSIGVTLAVISVSTIMWSMLSNIYKMISAPRIEPMSKPKIFITLTVFSGLVFAAVFFPLPLHVEATLIVEPEDIRHVYVQTPGELAEFNFKPGEVIQEGELIARLKSPEIEAEIRDLILKIENEDIQRQVNTRIGQLEAAGVNAERIATFVDSLQKTSIRYDALEIRAPVFGIVIPPARKAPADPREAKTQLSTWHGVPLNPRNKGAILDARTHLLSVAPLKSERIVVATPGKLVKAHVKPGDTVEQGSLIASLANPELQDQLKRLELLAESNTVAEPDRKAYLDEIDQLKQQIKGLEIRASVSGTVVGPTPKKARQVVDVNAIGSEEDPVVIKANVIACLDRFGKKNKTTGTQESSSWIGLPLDEKHVGVMLNKDVHLLTIVVSQKLNFQATMLIDQGDRNDIQHEDDEALRKRLADKAQTFEIKFDHLPANTYEATINEVSKAHLEFVPELLSNKLGGELPTVTDSQGRERLLSAVYQATLELTEDTELLRTGMRGRARFLVEKRTACQWAWRYICDTFRFRL
jgi:putative peptide zinc metalloprotease protein